MRRRGSRSRGFAIVFVVGMLALLSVLVASFVASVGLDRSLGRNFTHGTLAQLAAESGVEYAFAQLSACTGGPLTEAQCQALGPASAWQEREMESAGSGTGMRYRLRVTDESGKLNLNDPNAPWDFENPLPPEFSGNGGPWPAETVCGLPYNPRRHGRLEIMIGSLFEGLCGERLAGRLPEDQFVGEPDAEFQRGLQNAVLWMHHPEVGRAAYEGDRFPDWQAVEQAWGFCIGSLALSEAEMETLRGCLTIYSWRDPDTLKPGTRVIGPAGNDNCLDVPPNGTPLRAMLGDPEPDNDDVLGNDLGIGLPFDRWMQIQTRDFQLEPRSPVNLNTAPRAVMFALLSQLRGVYVEEGPAEAQSCEHYDWWSTGLGGEDPTYKTFGMARATYPLDSATAALIAYAMYARIHGETFDYDGDGGSDLPSSEQAQDGAGNWIPNPFETWEEFRLFLNRGFLVVWPRLFFHLPRPLMSQDNRQRQPWAAASYVRGAWRDPHDTVLDPVFPEFVDHWQRIREQTTPIVGTDNRRFAGPNAQNKLEIFEATFGQDLVFANFNPNSLFNDWNPNQNAYLAIDKAQLLQYTTEGCFEPAGAFVIQVEGEVRGPGGAVLARARIDTAVEVWATARLTSQAQFLRGYTEAGGLDPYMGRHRDDLIADPGNRAYRSTHVEPDGRHGTLQVYPELLLPGATARVHAARYDGNLQLSTYERAMELTSGGGELVSALANFNGLQADPLPLSQFGLTAFGAALLPTMTSDCFLATPGAGEPRDNRPHGGPVTGAFAAGDTPGNIYPDGAYSEKGRTIAYRLAHCNESAANNQGALVGSVQFWVKPNFNLAIPSRIRKLMCGPTRPGVYASQQWCALYYLRNVGWSQYDPYIPFWCSVDGGAMLRWGLMWNGTIPPPTGFGGLYGSGVLSPDRPFPPMDHTTSGPYNAWITPSCLAFGFAWQTGLSASAAGADYKSFVQATALSRAVCGDAIHGMLEPTVFDGTKHPRMRAHRWTHLSLGWRMEVAGMSTKQVRLAIDDILPASTYSALAPPEQHLARYEISNPYMTATNQFAAQSFLAAPPAMRNQIRQRFNESWLRFGEFAGDPDGRPYYADATVDNIQLHSAFATDGTSFRVGRYVNVQQTLGGGVTYIASYTSPAIPVKQYVPGAAGATLRSVGWTYYRATAGKLQSGHVSSLIDTRFGAWDGHAGSTVNPRDRQDPVMPNWASNNAAVRNADPNYGLYGWDPVSVDIHCPPGATDASGAAVDWYCADVAGYDRLRSYPGGSDCLDISTQYRRYRADDTFQFRLYFHLKDNTPIYESPVLDDVTLTFWPAGPRVLEYRVS